MSGLRTLLRACRLPTVVPRRYCRVELHLPTPAGPLGTWNSLKPRPDRRADAEPTDVSVLDPLRHPDFFRVRDMFTVEDLFHSRVHLGHKTGSLNPYMSEYLLGARLDVCVFDLDRTAALLRAALNFTAHVASRGGIVLLISRSPQHVLLVEKTARECGEYAHCRRWMAGTFTDSTRAYGMVTRMPDLVVMFNTLDTVLEPHPVIMDAAKIAIPTVGVVDTNCDPRLITYPVPGNDDSMPSIELYCRLFAEAIRRGKTVADQLEK